MEIMPARLPHPIAGEDLEAIQAFLATHTPRKFEAGATGDEHNLLNWLTRNGYKATRKFGMGMRAFVIDGKEYNREAFFQFASKVRAKIGLEPIVKL